MKPIEIIARAVITSRGRILLCRQKTEDYHFLPGGHVEFGESIEKALARELKEETGINVKKSRFLGIVENQFGKGKSKHHEINFIYKVTLKSYNIKNMENHIEFYWKDVAVFKQTSFLPLQLKKQLLSWLKRNLF